MAVAAGAVLPGCNRYTPDDSEAIFTTTGGVLRVHINNPGYIDPYNVTDSDAVQVCNALFDPLVTYDFRTGGLVPLAADSWEMDASGRTFVFHLREGATFHNGEAVTAGSFKYAWERIADPRVDPANPSALSPLLAPIAGYADLVAGASSELSGVVVVDDLTLSVSCTEPYPEFVSVLAHPGFSPVPAAAVDMAGFARAPIGNGPFMMNGTWVDGEYIRTVRFDAYGGTLPIIAGIDFMVFKDDATAFAEFQAGNLDFSAVPWSAIGDARRKYTSAPDGMTVGESGRLLDAAETAVCTLCLNVKDPVLSNVDVRRAICLAIDREALCSQVTDGICSPASGLVPPGVVGYRDDDWEDCRHDVQAAKDALVAAGYPGGTGIPRLVLSCDSTTLRKDVMKAIQGDLAAIGIASEIRSDIWKTYRENVTSGDFQLAVTSWMADYPSYDAIFGPLCTSGSSNDIARFENTSIDRMIADARAKLDDEERMSAWDDVSEAVGKAMPYVPLMYYAHHHVGAQRVNDLYLSPGAVLDPLTCWLSI